MTSQISALYPDAARHNAGSWAFSLLVHGLAVGLALIILGDLRLTPKPEPFKWNVAMVEPPPQPVVQPADSQPKPAQPAKQAPAPQPEASRPIERQTTIVQAVPTPQPTPTPVIQRQEPVQPVVERKPEPELKPEIKPEIPPPMPMVAKPVEPLIQHPTHHISTQSAESHAPPAEPVVEQMNAPAPVAPSHPAPPAPMVASVAPSAPVEAAPPASVDQAAQESAKEQPAESSPAPVQEAAVHHAPARSGAGHAAKADYGWLAQTLWDRVADLKRYPHFARLKHLEGKVVVRAVINESGHLARAEIVQSSGYAVLDEDALATLHKACPLHLAQPLGRAEVVVQVPISYRLH